MSIHAIFHCFGSVFSLLDWYIVYDTWGWGHVITDISVLCFCREKKELEMKMERLETAADESRLLMDSLRHEVVALKDSNATLQVGLVK